ncbi:MAG: nuclear transport factor 2 family protein [Acidimicrobiales bacterium]
MITAGFARQFAATWIGAWNRHDLDAVLAHCADDIELTAPRLPGPGSRLRGKTAVAAWWARALTAPSLTVAPRLQLTAVTTLTGSDDMVLLYRSGGRLHAQTFRFQPNGLLSHTAIHLLVPREPE